MATSLAMATSPAEHERGSLFAAVPYDPDAELSEEPFGVRARPKILGRRLAVGATLVVAAVAAVVLVWRQDSAGLASDDLSALEVKADKKKNKVEEIAPFQQCGGQGFSGSGCCQEGCACVKQNPYFSSCKAPKGAGTCNRKMAKAEIDEAKAEAAKVSPGALQAIKAAKQALALEESAKSQLAAAEAAFKKAEEEGAAVRKAKDEKEAAVAAAKKAAVDTEQGAKTKISKYEEIKDELEGIEKSKELRSHGKCGKLFSKCGPAKDLSKNEACCQAGCVCKWQGEGHFYAQCKNPNNNGGCDPKAEEKHVTEQKAKLVQLKKEHDELVSRIAQTKAHAEKVDKEAKEIRHKAAMAGTARAKAKNEMMSRKTFVQTASAERIAKTKLAKDASQTLHDAEVFINAWKQAAEGGHCKPGSTTISDNVDDLAAQLKDLDVPDAAPTAATGASGQRTAAAPAPPPGNPNTPAPTLSPEFKALARVATEAVDPTFQLGSDDDVAV